MSMITGVPLVPLLVKGTLILALPLLALPLLRSRSAAARHLAWSWALRGLLALPLLAAVLPSWSVLRRATAPAAEARVVAGRSARGRDAPTARWLAGPSPMQATAQDVAPATVSVVPSTTTISRLALGAWGLVALSLLIRLIASGVRVRRLRRTSSPVVDPAWTETLDEVASLLGLRHPPALLSSAGVASPCVVGLRRPAVVLPCDALAWDGARRRDVLLHELSHVARRDGLDIVLGRLAVAAWWFHPLAWLAERRSRVERERACDDAVLREGSPARRYANELLALAREGRSPLHAATAMAQRSGLEERVRAILDGRAPRTAAPRGTAWPVAALALAGLVAAAQAGAAPQRDALILTIDTGMTVDAAAMAAHVGKAARATKAGVEWERRLVDSAEGGWPRWLSPHAEGVFAPDYFTTFPATVTIHYALASDGTLTVGASGPLPDVLCVLSDGGVSTPVAWGSSLPEGRALTHGLLGLDARSTVLAFLAYRELLAAAQAHAVSGGPALVESHVNGSHEGDSLHDFDLLPFELENHLGRPITVVQAAIFCSQPSTRFAYGGPIDGMAYTDAPFWPIQVALNERWDPWHAPESDGIRIRQVSLAWSGVEHSYVACRAHGDNGNQGHVRLDGSMTKAFKNWEESAATVRLPDARPRHAELALSVTWSSASASVRAVALGGSLTASLPGEEIAPDRWVIPAE